MIVEKYYENVLEHRANLRSSKSRFLVVCGWERYPSVQDAGRFWHKIINGKAWICSEKLAMAIEEDLLRK